MLLGYNTNGLAHHDLVAAIELLAELGYQSVAITLDHGVLNPFAHNIDAQVAQIRELLERLGMRSVVETGARFLLDPRQKHEPTLVTADPAARARRIDFLKRAVAIARGLGSDCVSFWAGIVRDDAADEEAWGRLVGGLHEVLDEANRSTPMPLGFEPEPGMFIDTMDRYAELLDRLGDSKLQLTLDVGHLHCQGEVPIAGQIARWADRLVNVHIEDMRAGVHEHLMFGEGEMDFPPILAAFRGANYRGGLHVELSRHSHEGPQAARRARDFLAALLPSA